LQLTAKRSLDRLTTKRCAVLKSGSPKDFA
jgi:hypothetical protein